MLTFSVRTTQKGVQRSKLQGYQSIGKKAAETRVKSRKSLNQTTRQAIDHQSNAFEAVIDVDEKN